MPVTSGWCAVWPLPWLVLTACSRCASVSGVAFAFGDIVTYTAARMSEGSVGPTPTPPQRQWMAVSSHKKTSPASTYRKSSGHDFKTVSVGGTIDTAQSKMQQREVRSCKPRAASARAYVRSDDAFENFWAVLRDSPVQPNIGVKGALRNTDTQPSRHNALAHS